MEPIILRIPCSTAQALHRPRPHVRHVAGSPLASSVTLSRSTWQRQRLQQRLNCARGGTSRHPPRAALSTDQQVGSGTLEGEKGAADSETKEQWKPPLVKERKRVILVRHGESTWNATGRIQGSSNFSELTEKGVSQAETSRQMLAFDTFNVCFHSPLQRSSKTAAIIWGKRGEPMVPLDDLREIDLYSFQGLFKEEGKARYGAQYSMWQTDAANFEIDGHYPLRELWGRAQSCWDEVLMSSAQSILVVAHNAVNQAMVATVLGLGPEYFRMLLQSNCGVSVLDFQPISTDGQEPTTTLVSLNRLNQTPSPPVGPIQTAGRKARSRVILVCHGLTQSQACKRFPESSEGEKLNMLGLVQSRKTSELLLDVRADTIFSSPCPAATATAQAILEVQEAADCLGVECIPRFVEVVTLDALRDFDYGSLQGQEHPTGAELRQALAEEGGETLSSLQGRAAEAWWEIQLRMERSEEEMHRVQAGAGADVADSLPSGMVICVTHIMTIKAMVASCLGMGSEEALTFNIDQGSINVVDFPDGARGKGVVRCLNYTAHLGRWAVPVTSPSFGDDSF